MTAPHPATLALAARLRSDVVAAEAARNESVAASPVRYEHSGDGNVQLVGGMLKRPWVFSLERAMNERFECLERNRARAVEFDLPTSIPWYDRLITSLLAAIDDAQKAPA